MVSFDFIVDDEFRRALEADHAEMLTSIESSAFKASQVLAGSIVEAILVDALIAGRHVSQEDGLKLDLAQAVAKAKEASIISATTADLCSVLRGYRNLIHPGRSIRLQETATADTAEVAKALVAIVAKDVERRKRLDYGYTAQQIVGKLEKDSSAVSILSDILAGAGKSEVERLLLVSLPEAYLRAYHEDEPPEHVLNACIRCFRMAFDHASPELKRRTMTRFAKMLREESDAVILPYESAFVKATDFGHLSQQEAHMAALHFLGRLEGALSTDLLEAIIGIGAYLKEDDVQGFVDSLVKAALHNRDSEIRQLAQLRLVSEWNAMPVDIDHRLKARLDDWIAMYRKRDEPEYIQILEAVKSELEDFPF